ncbi:ATP-binding protein [Alteromonas sp. Cnat2-8]|nr:MULTISPECIES: ATP-binding protein [Alteromonas]MCG7653532.1 ATP-binding protein [Alteromonas sp. Cnat2-8]OZB99819.1 hypothetical protein BBP29_15140 [Alteromonas macleodii]
MKILADLKQRLSTSENPILGELYSLASTIETDCRHHLKRISLVLPEFDLHDESHSEKVLSNIESLLGDAGIRRLTSYELFFLHLAPFLHDCALAPPDWELKLLRATEGGEHYHDPYCLLKHDLKAPLKLSEAVSFIEANQEVLYQSFDEVSKWRFSPETQEQLHEELAHILVEYQEFRNGSKQTFSLIKSQDEYERESEAIRFSFIRANHHLRVEKYIANLSRLFEGQITGRVWGKKLASDLSKVCRSHCENVSYIQDSLDAVAHYLGDDTANLQLIALLLRLGDILHFSFDRAPRVLRTSREFQSEYSFQQWAMKDNGVNYSIGDGLISFKAFCESPRDYFKVHEYLDWVDLEIQNYFLFERKWLGSYIKLPEKVDRSGIKSDGSFIPKHGLKFTLSQRKILELLMGVGLYKDKYACLRELYQNSLDACRSMQASSTQEEGILRFKIEFDIERKGSDTFLICRDNGCGMTNEIIENYLLNIGNSYYRSSEFSRRQASWNDSFTPTSQFGIGILSCFMIGSSIEITTKTQGGDFVSCAIDGPHESFYYKTPSKFETEKIVRSGTQIKVLLNDSVATELNNEDLNKVELLLLREKPNLRGKFTSYKDIYANWDNHLFNKINKIVDSPFPNIDVVIKLKGKNELKLLPKPTEFELTSELESDLAFIDYLVGDMYWKRPEYLFSEVRHNIKTYKIMVEYKGIEFITHLSLPTDNVTFGDIAALRVMPIVGSTGVCIDGISVGTNTSMPHDIEMCFPISYIGLLNFTGEKRPQLSVDRNSITAWPEGLKEDMATITSKLTEQVLCVVVEHIKTFKLQPDSKEVRFTWDYLFDRFRFGSQGFIQSIINNHYGDVSSASLCALTGTDITISDFMKMSPLKIVSPNKQVLPQFTKTLLYGKLLSSNSIQVKGEDVLLEHNGNNFTLPSKTRYRGDGQVILIKADSWDVSYDLVSSMLPVVSPRLFDAVTKGDSGSLGPIGEKGIQLMNYSNGIGAFFGQSPLAIHDKMGLFSIKERDNFEEKVANEVYYFETKRSRFGLHEINEQESRYENKSINVLYLFVSPRTLTQREEEKLAELSSEEASYAKGVREGWSILITGVSVDNVVVMPGRQDRGELVKKLSPHFWEDNSEYNFKFLDGADLKEFM